MIHDGRAVHLYIHIPFCRYRCDYCDFFSRISVAPSRQEEVLQRTAHQVDAFLRGEPSREPWDIRTLYIGGGTPSLLTGGSRETLMAMVRTVRSLMGSPNEISSREVTVEVNPEDITEELVRTLRDAGVNRLSVGVQSLHTATLHHLGRESSVGAIRRALDILHRNWRGADAGGTLRWSADLIMGVPGSNCDAILQDAREIIAAGADHFSVYELTLEEHTVLYRRWLSGAFLPWEPEEILAAAEELKCLLAREGIHQYETSSYALPGSESRHNLAYWEMAPHAGFGPGAVGTLTEPLPVRHTGTRDFRQFLTAHDYAVTREALSRRTFAQELLMMGFRRTTGIDVERLEGILDIAFQDLVGKTMDRWGLTLTPFGDPPRLMCVVPAAHRSVVDALLVDAFRELDSTCPEQWHIPGRGDAP